MEALLRNIEDVEWVQNPKHREVYLKHLLFQKENERLSAHYVRVAAGGEIVPHTHEVLEIFYILKGRGLALVNGTRHEVGPGSIISAPAGSEHGIINDGEEDLYLFSVFSPGIV